MTFQFTNNAASTLASGVSNSATSMVVATGQGALFPTPTATDTFRATLIRASDDAIEIVLVTARSSDTMTVTRAQEGTTGLTLLAGDKFELRITAAYLNNQDVAVQTVAAASKSTPVDADSIPIVDSAASNVLKELTFANLRTWVMAFVLGTANLFTKAQRGAFVTLTDASTVAVDISLANQFNLTLGGNRTLGTPTNIVAGQQGVIVIYQDQTGSRTLAYTWVYQWAGGTAGVLSTPGATRDMLAYSVDYYDDGFFTVTIATPGVFTRTAHQLLTGHKVQLSTTGALPTGLTAATTYFVHVIDANTFHLSTTRANLAAATYIATTGSQSGTHSLVACGITLNLIKAIS